MLNHLRDVLAAYWQWLRRREGGGRGVLARLAAEKEQDRRTCEARARFWAEMRAGRQEAEVRSRAQPRWQIPKERGV